MAYLASESSDSQRELLARYGRLLTSRFGAGTQQVNHIEVVTNVNKDLQF